MDKHSSGRPNCRRPRLLSLFCAAALASVTFAGEAGASHFRFAHITWKRVGTTGNTVEFTSLQAWRADAVSPLAIDPGDGSSTIAGPDTIEGTFTDRAGEQYTVTRYTVQHTYAGEGPFTASIGSCCRISTLVNAPDGDQLIQTVVDLRNGNQGSPVSSIPPILQFGIGLNAEALPIVDPDGTAVTCRMATPVESEILTVASAGGNLLAVSQDCRLTWDTSAATDGEKYAAQIVIEEVGSSGSVALDFIIEITGEFVDPPECTLNGPTNNAATVDSFFSMSVTGTDPNPADLLTVKAFGLPGWLTLDNPPGPGPNGQPFIATFSGTPASTDAGTASVAVQFTDLSGLDSNICALTIDVGEVLYEPECTRNGPTSNAVTVGNPFSISVTGTDLNPNDQLTVEAFGLPGWLTLQGTTDTSKQPFTATFSGTPSSSDVGTAPVTVAVQFTDPFELVSDPSCDFTIDVITDETNSAPACTLDGATNNSVIAGEPFSISVTGTDPDVNDLLTVEAFGLPGWLALDGSAGPSAPPFTATFSGTPSSSDVGTNTTVMSLFRDSSELNSNSCDFTTTVMAPPPHTPVSANGWAEAVAVRRDSNGADTFAFVAAQQAGLLIYDVEDPDSIGTLGTFAPPAGECPLLDDGSDSFFADDVALAGATDDLALIAGGPCGLVIANVTDPVHPLLEGRMEFLSPDRAFFGWAEAVAISADKTRAYVADFFYGLRIVDISDRSAPSILATYGPADDPNFGNAIAIALDGSTAYVATTEGLRIVDVNADSPSQGGPGVDIAVLSSSPDAVPQDVVVAGDKIYLPLWQAGLRVLQTGGSGAPAEIQMLAEEGDDPFFKVATSGSRVFATQGLSGLRVFTANSAGLAPETALDVTAAGGLASDCGLSRTDPCWAWNVTARGDRVYVTLGDFRDPLGGRLQIIDFAPESSANVAGSAGGRGASGGGGGGMSVSSASPRASSVPRAARKSRVQIPVGEHLAFTVALANETQPADTPQAAIDGDSGATPDPDSPVAHGEPDGGTTQAAAPFAGSGGGVQVGSSEPRRRQASRQTAGATNSGESMQLASLDRRLEERGFAEILADRGVELRDERSRSSETSASSESSVSAGEAFVGSEAADRVESGEPAEHIRVSSEPDRQAVDTESGPTGGGGGILLAAGLLLVPAIGLVWLRRSRREETPSANR